MTSPLLYLLHGAKNRLYDLSVKEWMELIGSITIVSMQLRQPQLSLLVDNTATSNSNNKTEEEAGRRSRKDTPLHDAHPTAVSILCDAAKASLVVMANSAVLKTRMTRIKVSLVQSSEVALFHIIMTVSAFAFDPNPAIYGRFIVDY